MVTNRYPHMVHEYYVARIRRILEQRRSRIDQLRTRSDAEAYVRKTRRAVRRCFPAMPKRTPLNATITGKLELPEYVIEKILFETRPNFLASGNLYLPKKLSKKARGKRPGVLAISGHGWDGKAFAKYQALCQNLARRGFVVFTYDPIDQGERAQYYPQDGGQPLDKDGRGKVCNWIGHNRTGNPLLLTDDFFGTWRVWDALRALDYLCKRPEVDRTRLGVTGTSGGGTLSSYVTALDPRPTMAAPSCYICSFQVNMEWELPCDSEQNPPGMLAAGLDHADLLMCHAPRPTIILSQEQDFFSPDWAQRAAEDVRKVYRLLGAEQNVECFIGPGGHGFMPENREAVYKFFMKHAGIRGRCKENNFLTLPEKKLFAAPNGETYRAGSRRVFEFTADRAKELAAQRKKLSAKALAETARKLLAIPTADGLPCLRALQHTNRWNPIPHQHQQFAVETESGIQTILTVYGPAQRKNLLPSGNVSLYVGHTSGQEDIEKIPELRKLTRGRDTLVAVDPRGIGQSRAQTAGSIDFFHEYGSDFLYAANSDLLGESYLGRRVYDILRVMDLLLAGDAKQVKLIGRGMGAITAAFAALLHPGRPRVKLINYLPSYELIARTPINRWPLSAMLRGVLHHFDLPDVYRALAKRLTRSKPWDARMKPAPKRG